MLLGALAAAAASIWYTWWNPDMHLCYYYEGHVMKEFEYYRENYPEEAVNVSYWFKIWCSCGLVVSGLIILYGIIGFVF